MTQPTTPVPLQQLVPLHPLNPLVQQVGFHIAFVADFLTTGAVLFAREFAIPGALIQDIHSGTPVPVAVGRALQTFAQIELEAGRELVGFAAGYVSFQLNFLVNLVTTPVAAVGELATSLLAGLTPVAAAPAPVAHSGSEAVLQTRQSTSHGPTAATTPDEVTTTSTSSKTDTSTEQPKKFRLTVAESESVTSTTARLTTRTPTPLRQTKPMSTQRRQRRTAGPM